MEEGALQQEQQEQEQQEQEQQEQQQQLFWPQQKGQHTQ